jgi:uncharacterized protein YrrD
MTVIGDKVIPFENIETISNIEDIKTTKSSGTVIFDFNTDIMTYCKNNSVKYGVIVSSIKEAIYANALGAKYIISDINTAERIQKVAQNYMFDSRILAIIKDSSFLEEAATKEIDGVVYQNLIENI